MSEHSTEATYRVHQLLETTDARIWAQHFCDVLDERAPDVCIDEAFMQGWFANAIETGREAGRKEQVGRDECCENCRELLGLTWHYDSAGEVRLCGRCYIILREEQSR